MPSINGCKSHAEKFKARCPWNLNKRCTWVKWSKLNEVNGNKNIYFIPYGQDDPKKKPNSMVARMALLTETVEAAIEGKQIQPVLVERYKDSD